MAMDSPLCFSSSFRLRRQAGLSLVELMVGMTVGAIIGVGLLVLMTNSSRAFRVQDDFARLQENGTAALRYIGDDIRVAGFYGLFDGIPEDPPAAGLLPAGPSFRASAALAVGNDCGPTLAPSPFGWALDLSTPLFGRPSAVASDLPCVARENFREGPILVVRAAAGQSLPDPDKNGDLTDAPFAPDAVYIQSEPARGMLFYGRSYAEEKALSRMKQADSISATVRDAPIYEYTAHLYYIRPCSTPQPSDATCCPTGSEWIRDRDHPEGWCPGPSVAPAIPTLVRQQLAPAPKGGGASMQEQALVEGIERINYVYNPPVADPNIREQWNRVTSVTVTVLVRATQPTTGYDDSAKTYDLGPGVTLSCARDGLPCNYKRHVFSQTFQVRNRS